MGGEHLGGGWISTHVISDAFIGKVCLFFLVYIFVSVYTHV